MNTSITPITIETNRLMLFTAETVHLPVILDYLKRNHDFFLPWVPSMPEQTYDDAYQMQWIIHDQKLLKNQLKLKFYYICKNDPKKIIGDLSYSNIIKGAFLSCYLGYKQDKNMCGNGFMYEAIQAANNYMFHTIQLHRIEANIIPRNTSSIKLIESLGFIREGYSKHYLKINGVWEDHLRYAKLSNDES